MHIAYLLRIWPRWGTSRYCYPMLSSVKPTSWDLRYWLLHYTDSDFIIVLPMRRLPLLRQLGVYLILMRNLWILIHLLDYYITTYYAWVYATTWKRPIWICLILKSGTQVVFDGVREAWIIVVSDVGVVADVLVISWGAPLYVGRIEIVFTTFSHFTLIGTTLIMIMILGQK